MNENEKPLWCCVCGDPTTDVTDVRATLLAGDGARTVLHRGVSFCRRCAAAGYDERDLEGLFSLALAPGVMRRRGVTHRLWVAEFYAPNDIIETAMVRSESCQLLGIIDGNGCVWKSHDAHATYGYVTPDVGDRWLRELIRDEVLVGILNVLRDAGYTIDSCNQPFLNVWNDKVIKLTQDDLASLF